LPGSIDSNVGNTFKANYYSILHWLENQKSVVVDQLKCVVKKQQLLNNSRAIKHQLNRNRLQLLQAISRQKSSLPALRTEKNSIVPKPEAAVKLDAYLADLFPDLSSFIAYLGIE